MSKLVGARVPVSLILGAGASRAVHYGAPSFPSPLDNDFFELLQRLKISYKSKTLENKVKQAREFVIRKGLKLENGRLIYSMEELFYRLHQKALLHHQLFPQEVRSKNPDEELREKFTTAIQGLLRAAHGAKTCRNHARLFRQLRGPHSILTFNYDLVAERAFRNIFEREKEFGVWLYGLGDNSHNLPTIHKLHGSINWEVGDKIRPRQERWSDFAGSPGATGFNILLPYWEKRIWESPWQEIWRRAAQRLRTTERLIVWGYSLPVTDLKARELLRIGLRPDSDRAALKEVCIIDPNPETRRRWRQIFLKQMFWSYEGIDEFFHNPPPWYPVANV